MGVEKEEEETEEDDEDMMIMRTNHAGQIKYRGRVNVYIWLCCMRPVWDTVPLEKCLIHLSQSHRYEALSKNIRRENFKTRYDLAVLKKKIDDPTLRHLEREVTKNTITCRATLSKSPKI